ncbi:septum formation family protein [Aquipuribacter hungaricus]|uniref:Septum formation family protein n=1 Tax=Aquipuribacter hungaricus TaxID=545624 RepID=A0ABV7WGV0_9MICO
MRTPARLPVHVLALAAGALVLAGCSAASEPERDDAGAIVATEESADVFAIAVGDCTNDPDDGADELLSVEAVPCSGPHDNEAYHAEDLPDGDFPGEEEVTAAADEICFDAFEPFVGLAYEDSRLGYGSLTPTSDSWADGDREILCLVADYEGEPLVGSAQGLAE